MRPFATAAAALILVAVPAAAQQANWALPSVGSPARFTVGALGLGAAARGEFQSNLGSGLQGGGFTAFGLLRLDGAGVLSLRMEGGGVWYGSETQRVTVISPRIGAKVVTTNSIGSFSIGPELAVPAGPFRPYVNATLGVSAFNTSSSLQGLHDDNGDDANFNTTQQSDAVGTYGFGGGVRVPVGPRRWDFSMDLGTHYVRGGTAEYLKKGDITDTPDGTILNTRRSRTDFQTFYVGFAVGLHPSGPKSQR